MKEIYDGMKVKYIHVYVYVYILCLFGVLKYIERDMHTCAVMKPTVMAHEVCLSHTPHRRQQQNAEVG